MLNRSINIVLVVSIINLIIINLEKFHNSTTTTQLYLAFPTLSKLFQSTTLASLHPNHPTLPTYPVLPHTSNFTSPAPLYLNRSTILHPFSYTPSQSFHCTITITLYPPPPPILSPPPSNIQMRTKIRTPSPTTPTQHTTKSTRYSDGVIIHIY